MNLKVHFPAGDVSLYRKMKILMVGDVFFENTRGGVAK